MSNTAVLDHKADQFDLVLEVHQAEKMQDGSLHLIAPNGQLVGVLREDEGQYQFASTIESDGDRIHLDIPTKVAEGFKEEVEVVEK